MDLREKASLARKIGLKVLELDDFFNFLKSHKIRLSPESLKIRCDNCNRYYKVDSSTEVFFIIFPPDMSLEEEVEFSGIWGISYLRQPDTSTLMYSVLLRCEKCKGKSSSPIQDISSQMALSEVRLTKGRNTKQRT